MRASYKQIWNIAFPIIIGSIAQTLISVTDTAFMGRVNETAQAAIGLISMYYLIIFMIGYSYTKGTQIFVARRVGENKLTGVGEIFDNSMAVILLISTALFLFIKILGDNTLSAIVSDDDVRAASLQYLDMRAYGVFFGFAGSVFLAFYMGINSMPIILVSILAMSGINIFLNYVLIFGKLGFPELGISGAALASNISELVAFLIFMVHSIWKKFNIKYHLFKIKKISIGVISSITQLSLPIVMQTVLGLAAWMIFFTYVERMGEHELAISSVVKSIYMVYGIPSWGFSAASNTIISNLMGQGKSKQVLLAIKRIIVLSFCMTATLTITLAAFPKFFMSIYTNDPVLIEDGLPVLYICILALWIYSVSTILFHGIVSTGSTGMTLIIEIASVIAYLIFIQFIFSYEGKTLTLVWTSEIFYWVMTAIFTMIYLRTGHWKKSTL